MSANELIERKSQVVRGLGQESSTRFMSRTGFGPMRRADDSEVGSFSSDPDDSRPAQ